MSLALPLVSIGGSYSWLWNSTTVKREWVAFQPWVTLWWAKANTAHWHLQYAVVDLVLRQRGLVEWLPEHRAELVDVVHLDVNHRPGHGDGSEKRLGRQRHEESKVRVIDDDREGGKKRDWKKISESHYGWLKLISTFVISPFILITVSWKQEGVSKYFWGFKFIYQS